MKTITKRFVFDDGEVVTVRAWFAASALCQSPLEYQGDARRIAGLTNDVEPPAVSYAEGFRDCWQQFNGKGVRIETTEEGEWQEVML
jgi:hypothetical protein